ncbi:MAG: hypothetical protein NDJ89_04630 [Oligoflexia bacterium]|nr:hypothetical protein [Oligoflexia bacterium]
MAFSIPGTQRKVAVLLGACALGALLLAGVVRAEGDDYGDSTPGGGLPELTKDQFLKDKANLACEGSLCKIFSVSLNSTKFTVSTFVGTNNRMNNGNSSSYNVYYGGGDPYNNPNYNLNEPGYGIQLTWEKTNCTKTVNVDKSVYEAVTTYMTALVNAKPGEDPTFPAFTPAEQTMILFYTTVMNLVKGATCS